MSDPHSPDAREETRADAPGPEAAADAATSDGSAAETGHDAPEPLDPGPAPVPHAGARYAVLRLSLLVTVGGVLYLLGLRGWVLLFVAVLASGLLSFFLFVRQREAAARNLEASLARRQARNDAAPGAATEPAGGTEAP